MKNLISPFALVISTALCAVSLALFISVAFMHAEARLWVSSMDARIETARTELAEMKAYCQSVVGDQL